MLHVAGVNHLPSCSHREMKQEAPTVPIGVHIGAPGMTETQCDQLLNRVAHGEKSAPGLLYHAGGASEDGVCIIDVRES